MCTTARAKPGESQELNIQSRDPASVVGTQIPEALPAVFRVMYWQEAGNKEWNFDSNQGKLIQGVSTTAYI